MREKQAAQVAAAFLLRAGEPIRPKKLTKLMYLVEQESIRQTAFPIVFDDIFAMRQGMVLSRTYDLMVEKPGTPTTGEWDQHIVRTSRGLNIRRGVSEKCLGGLSRRDVSIIDQVWQRYGYMSFDELVHEIHHRLEEWLKFWDDKRRRTSAIKLPYAHLVERLRGLSSADAVHVAEEIDYFQAISDSGETRKVA